MCCLCVCEAPPGRINNPTEMSTNSIKTAAVCAAGANWQNPLQLYEFVTQQQKKLNRRDFS